MKQSLIFLLVFVIFSSIGRKPNQNKAYHLFKIERSKDPDVIIYDVNLDEKNMLNLNSPITIYWLKNGKKEPLTWIQSKYSYGLEFIEKSKEQSKFQFVSYNKRQFQIKKDTDSNYKVFTNSNNRTVIVNKIFVQIDGGTFWIPKIPRVELHGQDIRTKEKLIEIINP